MDSVTDVFDGDTIAQNNGVSEIGTIARLLGENADQIQVLPQRIKQVVKVQLHFATEKAIINRKFLKAYFLHKYNGRHI